MVLHGESILFVTLLLPSTYFGDHEYRKTSFSIQKNKTIYSLSTKLNEFVCDSVAACAVVCSQEETCCRVSFNTQTKLCLLDSSCTDGVSDMADGIIMTKEYCGGENC